MPLSPDLKTFCPSLHYFNEDAQALFKSYYNSPSFERYATYLFGMSAAGINLRNHERGIAGSFFEEIAFYHIEANHAEDRSVILSPYQTNWLYDQIYPTAHLYSFCGLTRPFLSVSVPDGLIFRQGKKFYQLCGACEYTLLNNAEENPQKITQLRRFENPNLMANDLGLYEKDLDHPDYGKQLGELLCAIRPDLPFKPISLANSWRVLYAYTADAKGNKEAIHLPFDKTQFGYFVGMMVDNLTQTFCPDDSQLNEDYYDQKHSQPPRLLLSSLWSKIQIPFFENCLKILPF